MLRKLLTGDCVGRRGELPELLAELRARMLDLEIAAFSLSSSSPATRHSSLYGPFIGRAYIEIAATALLARLDPLRILLARRHQASDYYTPTSRTTSAIQWSGDVLSRVAAPDKKWGVDHTKVDFRSLLGPWVEELVWIPAFERFSDEYARFSISGNWVVDLSKKTVDGMCREIASRLEGIYSKFSKGVHSELLGDGLRIFDNVSMGSDFREVAQRLTCLALLSHFSDYFHYRFDSVNAIFMADSIEGFFNER